MSGEVGHTNLAIKAVRRHQWPPEVGQLNPRSGEQPRPPGSALGRQGGVFFHVFVCPVRHHIGFSQLGAARAGRGGVGLGGGEVRREPREDDVPHRLGDVVRDARLGARSRSAVTHSES